MKSPLPAFNSVTASAKVIPPKRTLAPRYEKWQDQLWDYYDRLGEFEAGVAWRANAMSRVRLLAAELAPGGNEPIPVDKGPAAEAMERLAGGTGGQAQLMREMTIHLSVPGEGWLVGETAEEERWFVASADELRVGSSAFQLREDESQSAWRNLSPKSVVVRFWDPHPRYGWRADSNARHAMNAMIELDLINKRIIAEILSRLASNGILLYDKGKLSFPPVQGPEGNPEDATQVDPFAAVLVDVASRGISDPTSPEATIPIPIGFDLQDLTDIDPKLLLQHIKIADFLDDKILAERDSAVKRLATNLDMPVEVLLGMGGLNHWGAWQVEETGIKIHIAPKAELITYSLTTGYLVPFLKASNASLVGPNGGRLVVWYDPSEITVRPDRSANTLQAYTLGEVPGRVLRREIGLSEDGDAPTPEEYREWLTRFLGRNPATAASVLDHLGGMRIEVAPPSDSSPSEVDDDDSAPENHTGPPSTLDDLPPNLEASLQHTLELANQLPPHKAHEILTTLLDRWGSQSRTSTWVEAHTPLDERVTPERRNGQSTDAAEMR